EQLTAFERGGIETLEEILGGDAALAFSSGGYEGRAQRERASRELRRGIAEGAAAAEGAAVPDRRGRDMRHGGGAERQEDSDIDGALELDVAGERAAAHVGFRELDAGERGD